MLRLSILILSLVTAATAGAVTLTLDRAPDYALAHNLTLAAARLRIEEARGRVLGAGRLMNPELAVEFSQNVRMPERSVGVRSCSDFRSRRGCGWKRPCLGRSSPPRRRRCATPSASWPPMCARQR